MVRLLNRFRWRLARAIAPSPVVTAPPAGKSRLYLFIEDGPMSAWIPTKSGKITIDTKPPMSLGSSDIYEPYVPSEHTGRFAGRI